MRKCCSFFSKLYFHQSSAVTRRSFAETNKQTKKDIRFGSVVRTCRQSERRTNVEFNVKVNFKQWSFCCVLLFFYISVDQLEYHHIREKTGAWY